MTHRTTPCDVCGGVLIQTSLSSYVDMQGYKEIYEERCFHCENLLYGWSGRIIRYVSLCYVSGCFGGAGGRMNKEIICTDLIIQENIKDEFILFDYEIDGEHIISNNIKPKDKFIMQKQQFKLM